MKKIISIIALFLVFIGVQLQSLEAGKKILVVYFSRVGISPFSNNIDAVSSASLIIGEN